MQMHRDGLSTAQIMRQVIYALALGILALVYFQGFGVLVQLALALVSALVVEALMLRLRKLPIKPALSDGSAALTAVLLAISIPAIAPWWIVVLGVAFAIVFGKQLYGGLGHNPFNPAMLAYAFLLISYPVQMSTWPGVFIDLSSAISLIFGTLSVDAYTGATQLDAFKTALSMGQSFEQAQVDSQVAFWSNVGFLLGGLYLLGRKIIFWQIPTALILGMALTSGLLFLTDQTQHLAPSSHLLLGGTMLGAFFIATDPVTASTTHLGRLIYGFLIGVLIVLIRSFGAYPDAIAFSILLMNITVPLIDYYTRPRAFGQ